MTIESCGTGWGVDAYRLVNILIGKPCKGYYLRWWYNGWHYWFFLPGETTITTEGEDYRTIGTRSIRMGTGQVILTQIQAIRTILNTREVYLLTADGWKHIRIDPGSMKVYGNQLNGYEAEIIAVIGSKEISYITGFSPVTDVPIVDPVPDPDACGIVIGTQVWACKNVASNFPNSKVYANDEANRAIYGGLYTWYQVTSSGFVPPGWHVPTNAEWQTLIDFIGDPSIGGGILKETGTDHWLTPNAGALDVYGFKALGAGWANASGYFYGLHGYGDFWTADEESTSNAHAVQLAYNTAAVGTYGLPKGNWFSVRLIKDSFAALLLIDKDSNVYTSVIIGTQEWLVENLKTTTYANGVSIPNLPGAGTQYNDYYLPSLDETQEMRTVLYDFGVGGLTENNYWTSTEVSATQAYSVNMFNGAADWDYKYEGEGKIRPCRSFVDAPAVYALRDVGPGGGLIFYIDGAGTTYLEAAPIDLDIFVVWSSVYDEAIGTTGSAIGTGQANTTAIIGQTGHTFSAAEVCDELIIDSGGTDWVDDTDGAYCYYNNFESYKEPYGPLYNWYAVNNANGIAYFERNGVQEPEWRVASDTDWDALIAALGGAGVAGGKLKELGLTHWLTPNTGADNSSGFTGVGTGYRQHTDGTFGFFKRYCFFWTTHEVDDDQASYSGIGYTDDNCDVYDNGYKAAGMSVRCMRDV